MGYLRDIGEFGIIERIKREARIGKGVIVGIGDDCAVLSPQEGQIIVTCDDLVEGVHFYPSISPQDLGWKALAVSLSDIAGMGGIASYSLLSLVLTPLLTEEWLSAFLQGWNELSEAFSVSLVGGNVSQGEKVNITSIVIGFAEKPLLRSTAEEGDVLFVTGYLGDSAGGLLSLQKGLDFPDLQKKHLRPIPRLAEGRALAEVGGRAMIDISDGLAGDLQHLCRASGKGAVVWESAIPLSDGLKDLCQTLGLSPLELALFGGEDYELLVSGEKDLPQKVDFPLYPIGEIVEGEEIFLEREGRRELLKRGGYEHLRMKGTPPNNLSP